MKGADATTGDRRLETGEGESGRGELRFIEFVEFFGLNPNKPEMSLSSVLGF
jgi:hypothetical protein